MYINRFTSLRIAFPSLVITIPPIGSINICVLKGIKNALTYNHLYR